MQNKKNGTNTQKTTDEKKQIQTKLLLPRVHNKKILVVFLFLFFCVNISFSQECISWVQNEKLQFKFGYVGSEFNAVSNSYVPSKYIVIIDLDSNERNCINQFSYEVWMNLLRNSNSDFATALLLYSITEKDAMPLYKITRKDWLLSGRDNDLKYWSEYLKKSRWREKNR